MSSFDRQKALDALADESSVFILAKLLSYMTGMEFGHCMNHVGSLMAEVDVLVEERGSEKAWGGL